MCVRDTDTGDLAHCFFLISYLATIYCGAQVPARKICGPPLILIIAARMAGPVDIE